MMWTISLVLIALGFGGALETTGCLRSIINAIKSKAKTFAGTQIAAVGTAPLIGIFYAYVVWFSPKATKAEKEEWESSGAEIAKFNKDGTPVTE